MMLKFRRIFWEGSKKKWRVQVLQHNLKELKIKIIKSKSKEYKFGVYDQD